MNKSAVLFALSSAFVGGFGAVAMAFDDDPGLGPERPPNYFGTEDRSWRPTGPVVVMRSYGLSDREVRPLYYKPTMRYYGNGYTVNYRYIAVYRSGAFAAEMQGDSSNFRTEAFRLSPEEVAKWGANAPRLTVRDSSSAPRSAVTSIVKKKPAGRVSTKAAKGKEAEPTDGTPAIVPLPDNAPVPAPDTGPAAPPKP